MKRSMIKAMIKDWQELLKKFIAEHDFNSCIVCKKNIQKLEGEL